MLCFKRTVYYNGNIYETLVMDMTKLSSTIQTQSIIRLPSAVVANITKMIAVANFYYNLYPPCQLVYRGSWRAIPLPTLQTTSLFVAIFDCHTRTFHVPLVLLWTSEVVHK